MVSSSTENEGKRIKTDEIEMNFLPLFEQIDSFLNCL